jgi:hypothetical protein
LQDQIDGLKGQEAERASTQVTKDLAAACYAHERPGKIFSHRKAKEFALLDVPCEQSLIDVIQRVAALPSFKGRITTKVGTTLSTETVCRVLVNVVFAYVAKSFEFFAEQLKDANNDGAQLLEVKPKLKQRPSEAVELLKALGCVAERHPALIQTAQAESVRAFGQSILHRCPGIAKDLGITEQLPVAALRNVETP